MERHHMAAFMAVARCLPSTLMARVLRTCIVLLAATTEVIRTQDWFYLTTTCMGRRCTAGVRAMARCLPSTLMARVLRTCIASLRFPPTLTATEHIHMPD